MKLGSISFGGPAAHVALMEEEFVRRRQWLTREEFLDLLSATNFIPGPNSTEMALHIGHQRAGWRGLIVAGICFIAPAALLTSAAAFLYVHYGSMPVAQEILSGIKPVILAVILQAIWSLSRSALKSGRLRAFALVVLTANLCGVGELPLIFAAGVIAWIAARPSKPGLVAVAPLVAPVIPLATATPAFSLGGMFVFFLKTGSVLFGSGYVLLAFLRADLVERWGWLTEAQLLDAVAVGQFTPGPLFSTATFIGYVLGAGPGAALATVGIFLPAFFFVALSAPWIPRLRKSRALAAALDGVNAATFGVMAATALVFARKTITDVPSVLLLAVAALLLLKTRVNSAWLVLLGGAVGFFFL